MTWKNLSQARRDSRSHLYTLQTMNSSFLHQFLQGTDNCISNYNLWLGLIFLFCSVKVNWSMIHLGHDDKYHLEWISMMLLINDDIRFLSASTAVFIGILTQKETFHIVLLSCKDCMFFHNVISSSISSWVKLHNVFMLGSVLILVASCLLPVRAVVSKSWS